MRCNCENSGCQVCKGEGCTYQAGEQRFQLVGLVCDGCAHYMPERYRVASITTVAPSIRLDHLTDGPLTPFVLMSRACHFAAQYPQRAEEVANALHTALTEHGWVREGEEPSNEGA